MSREAKPIAVVYFHHQFGLVPVKLQEAMDERWPDYHVIVVPVHEQERAVELEVFYDKNFTKTNYEDLKKWIADYLQPSPPIENKP